MCNQFTVLKSLQSVLLMYLLCVTMTTSPCFWTISGRIVLRHTSVHSSVTLLTLPLPSPPTPSPLLHLHAVNHLPSHPKSTHHTVTTPCVYILVKTTTGKKKQQLTNSLAALFACTSMLSVKDQVHDPCLGCVQDFKTWDCVVVNQHSMSQSINQYKLTFYWLKLASVYQLL